MAKLSPFKADRIIDAIDDLLIVTDKEHKLIWINQRVEEVFGIPGGSVRGKTFQEVLPIEKAGLLLTETIDNKMPVETSYEASTVKIKTGTGKYFYKISVAPIFEKDEVGGALIKFTDISHFEDLENIKNDFVSIVSHEFRTPLTSLTIGVGMLQEGLLGNLSPSGKEIVSAMENDCARLNKLVDNLLELSRMEAGHIFLESEVVDVYRVIEEAIRPFAIQARTKGVEIVKDLPEGLPPVAADFNKAVWVLTNLLGNGLRYTEKGGKIIVSARPTGKRVFFSVEDSGCGIPKSYLYKIFKKFIQVQGNSMPSGGAGLGLAICKEIVEAHGGQIWADSIEGKGSIFTFTLPVFNNETEILGNANST